MKVTSSAEMTAAPALGRHSVVDSRSRYGSPRFTLAVRSSGRPIDSKLEGKEADEPECSLSERKPNAFWRPS